MVRGETPNLEPGANSLLTPGWKWIINGRKHFFVLPCEPLTARTTTGHSAEEPNNLKNVCEIASVTFYSLESNLRQFFRITLSQVFLCFPLNLRTISTSPLFCTKVFCLKKQRNHMSNINGLWYFF